MSVIDDILEMHKYEPLDEMTLFSITDAIKKSCSGDYDLVLTRDGEKILIDFKFETPEEAVIFKLRYGQWMY